MRAYVAQHIKRSRALPTSQRDTFLHQNLVAFRRKRLATSMARAITEAACCNDVCRLIAPAIHPSEKMFRRTLKDGNLFHSQTILCRIWAGVSEPHRLMAVITAASLLRKSGIS